MPVITISTYSGRTQREKDRLAEAITDDVIKILNVDKKDVIIVFHESPMEIGMQKALDSDVFGVTWILIVRYNNCNKLLIYFS